MDDELTKMTRVIMARHYALHVFVAALLENHPNPDAVKASAEGLAERMRAQLLPSRWSDADLADFDEQVDSLYRMLAR